MKILWMILFPLSVWAQPSSSSDLVAIGILLLPDAAMLEVAKESNYQLRQSDSAGFTLDESQTPQMNLAQAFVREQDLKEIGAKVEKALQSSVKFPLKLTATGYEFAVGKDRGVVSFTVVRSPELLQLSNLMVEILRPYAVKGGTAEAFVKKAGDEIHPASLQLVENFISSSSGKNYRPHMAMGIARRDYIKAMQMEPFHEFDFTGVNVAIYQLGNLGTAEKELWTRGEMGNSL